MSLNWDASKVKDIDAILDNEGDRYMLDAFIWGSLSTGINEITEKNAEQVAARFAAIEGVDGAWLRSRIIEDDGSERVEDTPITLEDVKRFVGLRTNASPKTKAQFRAYIGRLAADKFQGDKW